MCFRNQSINQEAILVYEKGGTTLLTHKVCTCFLPLLLPHNWGNASFPRTQLFLVRSCSEEDGK